MYIYIPCDSKVNLCITTTGGSDRKWSLYTGSIYPRDGVYSYSAGATGPVGPVFTGPLLAPSYTICIRVS